MNRLQTAIKKLEKSIEKLIKENKQLREKIKRLESDLLNQVEDLDDTLIEDELESDDSYDYTDGFCVRD